MKTKEKVDNLAHFEIEWWKAHHRKQKDAFVDNMARLYALQFDIKQEVAKTAVLHRVEAANWHDKAEDCEDNDNQRQADIYWDKAEECLKQHFEILEG